MGGDGVGDSSTSSEDGAGAGTDDASAAAAVMVERGIVAGAMVPPLGPVGLVMSVEEEDKEREFGPVGLVGDSRVSSPRVRVNPRLL